MRATPIEREELERFIRGDLMDQFGNSDKSIAQYLAAEVVYQRQWMARVAHIIEVQALDMPKLTKCRRTALERTVASLRDLVRGRNVPAVPSHLAHEYDELTAVSPLPEGES